MEICSEEVVRGTLTNPSMKLQFAKDRKMNSLEEVHKWMITTRQNFVEMVQDAKSVIGITLEELINERFENAKVGDKVICMLRGEGTIDSVNGEKPYSIGVEFSDDNYDFYLFDGRISAEHKNPSLFYLGENGEMLTKRPEPKPLTIHPDKVPVDTKVLCWDIFGSTRKCKRFYATTGCAYANGGTSWSSESSKDGVTMWNFMQLAEELTVDGTIYPVGTMIEEG